MKAVIIRTKIDDVARRVAAVKKSAIATSQPWPLPLHTHTQALIPCSDYAVHPTLQHRRFGVFQRLPSLSVVPVAARRVTTHLCHLVVRRTAHH